MALAKWQQAELVKCKLDPAYFIHTYCQIDDAQGLAGDESGTMPFHLWPAQVGVIDTLLQAAQTIVLKARQLGLSWILCGIHLQEGLFTPGQAGLLLSKGQDEADELARRIQVMYDRLPDWMRGALPKQTKANTGYKTWSNGSSIRSLAATQNTGRSFTASRVTADEFAFIQWADKIYTALKPTVDGGGKLTLISTANGIGNLFHKIWTRAIAGLNRFTPIFLPWQARPGRTQAWYDALVADAEDPALVKQEYPATAEEAFLVSGSPRFDPTWVQAQSKNVRAPLPTSALPAFVQHVPGLDVYALPVRGRRYLLGPDVAEGKEHGDECDTPVIDAETWEEVAHLNGIWEPDTYAGYVDAVMRLYGAECLPERNNHGHAFILALKQRLTQRHALDKLLRGPDGDWGWLTTSKSKPLMIDNVAVALRDTLVTIRSQATLQQLLIYVREADGDTNAPSGYKDDRVMSLAIVLMAAKIPRVVARPAVGGERKTYTPGLRSGALAVLDPALRIR